MMTMKQNERRSRNLPSDSLITLETMAAAAKAALAQSCDDHHRVTIVSCELVFEGDAFETEFVHVIETR